MEQKKGSLCASCPHFVNYDEKRIVFSFQYIDKSALDDFEFSDFKALLDQFKILSTLTWKQIRQSGRHGLGTEKIDSSDISAKIPNIIDEDITLLAIRYKGKAPMIGFRERDIFHILWIDRTFTLYKH